MSTPIWAENQRVTYFSDPAVVVSMTNEGRVRIRMDRGRFDDDGDGYQPKFEDVRAQDLATVQLTTLEDYAIHAEAGNAVPMSPYGYVVQKDGTILGLTKQWAHGLICALLYPDIALAQGYGPPYRGASVHHYQRFELDNQSDFDLVRIAFGGLMYSCNISKGDRAATPAQIESVRRILIDAHGYKINEEVQGNLRSMTVRTLLKELAKTDED